MWTESSDPEQNAITFAEWGERLAKSLSGNDEASKFKAMEGLTSLTRRLDAMWSDGGGAYAFAPQQDLTVIDDEWVIAY